MSLAKCKQGNDPALEDPLRRCQVCPRKCLADRRAGQTGFCGLDAGLHLSFAGLHLGEEPCFTGKNGVGNFFFSSCNLACVYCQNHQISQARILDRVISSRDFVEEALRFQDQGAHFIGLVTPSPQVPQIRAALVEARKSGLALPVIYNSSGYDSVEQLKTLDGLVDVYLPDLKYASDEAALTYSRVPGYVAASREAVLEMFRQTGPICLDPDTGLARRGVWVRHLVLPRGLAGTWETLCFLALEVSPRIGLSLMSQYTPLHRAWDFDELSRALLPAEYDSALSMARDLGFENVLVQDLETAPENAVPDFSDHGMPFKRF